MISKYIATEHGFYNMLTDGAIIRIPRKADLDKYLAIYGDSSNEPPVVECNEFIECDCEDDEDGEEVEWFDEVHNRGLILY